MDASDAPYIVREGDYLAQLAFRHGFDANEAWTAPRNRPLKDLRKDPNVLAPGDMIYFTKKNRPVTVRNVAPGAVVKFVARVVRLKFQVRICDHRGLRRVLMPSNGSLRCFGWGLQGRGGSKKFVFTSIQMNRAIRLDRSSDNPSTWPAKREPKDLSCPCGSMGEHLSIATCIGACP